MDWNERYSRKTFSEFYMKYLNKAQNELTDEQKEQLKAPLTLTQFEKSALISILKRTISKISVINRGYDGKNKLIELPVPKPPMNIRFEGDILDELYDKQTLQPLRECLKAMSISKLQTDIEIVRCALEVCLKELQENDRFSKFADFIFNENRESHDEYNLLKAYSENMEKLNELQQELHSNRQKNEKLIEELDNELFQLKSECENKRKIHRMEENMVKKWEAARQEQVAAIFNHELTGLVKERDEYEEKTERELIAINEIMAFYRAKCSKLENSISSWKHRFEAERNDLDDQIKHTQANIEDVRSKQQLIKSCYEKQTEFIENYLMEQKQLAEQLKLEQKQTSAAIRVQGWWRGTMVRRQLGPYRPKKKNKKQKGIKKK